MKTLAIIIPLYKIVPTETELLSLKQCFRVFGNKYSIVFISYKEFDFSNYLSIISGKIVEYQFFDAFYFESIAGYNKLMLSAKFYDSFSRFEFILIYQLDAYIFKDEMQYWCGKNYDYIGAPFVDWEWSTFYAGFLTLPRRLLKRVGYQSFNLVGNGGLSLRKVSTFAFNLKLFRHAASCFKLNEDYFFSFYINSYNPFFKVAPFHDALKFSFDENPDKSFELNNRQLPMGCHAWPKYVDFWSKYIM